MLEIILPQLNCYCLLPVSVAFSPSYPLSAYLLLYLLTTIVCLLNLYTTPHHGARSNLISQFGWRLFFSNSKASSVCWYLRTDIRLLGVEISLHRCSACNLRCAITEVRRNWISYAPPLKKELYFRRYLIGWRRCFCQEVT